MDLALRLGPIKLCTLASGKITNPTARESLHTLLEIITTVNGSNPGLKARENTSKAMEIHMWVVGIAMNLQGSAFR